MGALDRVFRGRRGGQERPLAAQVAALFANGEQGLWYDVEGFRDAWNSVGPERLANPSFDDGLTGWTVAQPAGANIGASGGVLSFTTDGATYAAISQSATLNVGTLYVVTLEGVSGTGSLKVVGIDTEVQLSASRSFIGRATSTTFAIARVSGVAAAMSIGRVSVKEWTGLPTCNLFQDAAGTTPAYMPGQGSVDPPVGLVMDRRKGIARGPEMLTNGDFSADVGWTKNAGWSIGGGSAVRAPDASVSTLTQNITLSAGTAYLVTYTIGAIAAGSITPRLSGGTTVLGAARSTAGTYSEIIFSASGNSRLELYATAPTSASIDSISIKELSGNHAYQTTTASRPTLSARYNLLTGSEQLSGAGWSVVAAGSVSLTRTSGYPSPAGEPNAARLDFSSTATGEYCILRQIATVVSGVYMRPSIWLRADTPTTVYVRRGDQSGYDAFLVTSDWAQFFPTSGAATSSTHNFDIGLKNSSSGASAAATIYAWGADLRAANDGAGLPSYQRVVDATTYDTAGFPLYLKFDGVDDFLQTTVDFSGTDKLMLSAAIRRLSDSGLGVVLESTSDYSASNGTFVLLAPGASGTPSVGFNAKGTVLTGGLSYTTSAAPVGLLVSAYADIAASYRALRVNGVQVASSTTSIGIGAFGNAVLYLGRRAGSSLPFNGRLYGLLLRGAAANDGTFARVERYLNQKGRVA